METSPEQPSTPSHKGKIRLNPDVIQVHLRDNKPIDREKALMIFVMQNSIDEWDTNFGLGIARGDEW